MKGISEELQRIDRILCEESAIRYNYTWLTPTNMEEEFERFQSQEGEYDPVFTYRDFDVTSTIQRLESLSIPDDSKIGRLLERVRKDILAEARALDRIGSDSFDTTELFGIPGKEVVAEARRILESTRSEIPEEEKPIRSRELGKELDAAIRRYGLSGWSFAYDKDFLATVSVSSGSKSIRIRDETFFSRRHLTKLIVHEIGTHALRTENGLLQPLRIVAHGLSGYLPTEEGIAGYNERVKDVVSPVTEYMYALRALATSVAATGSFTEVYKEIKPYMQDDRRAFFLTVRVKRGLGDTSKPGGYLKDHSYLQGKLLIEDFIERGGDVTKLYAGKIGVDDLWLVDEGILELPRYIPSFYHHPVS